jgi:hypothetical protein
VIVANFMTSQSSEKLLTNYSSKTIEDILRKFQSNKCHQGTVIFHYRKEKKSKKQTKTQRLTNKLPDNRTINK